MSGSLLSLSYSYVFQQQEGQNYLGFFVNDDGSGEGLALDLLNYFDEYGINYENLEVVGMDGTSVNTGYKVFPFKY